MMYIDQSGRRVNIICKGNSNQYSGNKIMLWTGIKVYKIVDAADASIKRNPCIKCIIMNFAVYFMLTFENG